MAKRIYLSPSNQSGNSYATGGTNEMAQCDKIAKATASALKRCGFEVKVGKSGDSMQNRCNESDSFKADIHMPIHTNAYNGKVTGGTRIFCLNSNGKKACQAVLNELGKISPGTADSITYQTGLYEINVPNALTIYVECEFHDTKTGSDWIIKNTANIGEAICKGLCSYYGVNYQSGITNSNKEDEEMIKFGLTNNAIWSYKQHLRMLKAMGVITTSVDNNGGFGNGTLKATKEVQKAAGITVDGIVGENTIKAVYSLETKAYNALNSKITNAKKALA